MNRTRLIRDWHVGRYHLRLVHRNLDGYRVSIYVPEADQARFGDWFDSLRRFPTDWALECPQGEVSIGKTVAYGWSLLCTLAVDGAWGRTDAIAEGLADDYATWAIGHLDRILGVSDG